MSLSLSFSCPRPLLLPPEKKGRQPLLPAFFKQIQFIPGILPAKSRNFRTAGHGMSHLGVLFRGDGRTFAVAMFIKQMF